MNRYANGVDMRQETTGTVMAVAHLTFERGNEAAPREDYNTPAKNISYGMV
ncbi:MAG: hypothetical protein LBD43_00860 [Holosporales bacterium]|jgi:hypothetical protein|nr:hypothetical protein [Holosporales bacterium]